MFELGSMVTLRENGEPVFTGTESCKGKSSGVADRLGAVLTIFDRPPVFLTSEWLSVLVRAELLAPLTLENKMRTTTLVSFGLVMCLVVVGRGESKPL